MLVPTDIRELGYKHRRKNYKYINLPTLQEKLNLTRSALINYRKFYEQYNSQLDLRPWSKNLINDLIDKYMKAWMDYYGADAAHELKTFYCKEVVDMAEESLAIIMVIYEMPFKYTKVHLNFGDKKYDFVSGNPVKDWEDAQTKLKELHPDQIIYHDSCQTFVPDSNYMYAYTLDNKRMVRMGVQ